MVAEKREETQVIDTNCLHLVYTLFTPCLHLIYAVTTIAPEKQADCILLTLETDGQNLALQVPVDERRNRDGTGVTKILKQLDTLYEQNTTQKLFSSFEDFENFKRKPEVPLAKYISEFELKVTELKALKVTTGIVVGIQTS